MGVRGLRGNSAHDELCTLMFRCLNDSKKGFGSFISGRLIYSSLFGRDEKGSMCKNSVKYYDGPIFYSCVCVVP